MAEFITILLRLNKDGWVWHCKVSSVVDKEDYINIAILVIMYTCYLSQLLSPDEGLVKSKNQLMFSFVLKLGYLKSNGGTRHVHFHLSYVLFRIQYHFYLACIIKSIEWKAEGDILLTHPV